jgi:hypothetical protein
MRQTTLISLPVIVLLAGGCSSVGAEYIRVVGGSDAWAVSAAQPRVDSLGECHDDPSVETAVLSADMPSSVYGLRLVSGSTEADALRLADCLAEARASDEITINSPGV